MGKDSFYVGTEMYDLLRYAFGLPEGNEVKDKMPHPYNMEMLNALSFDKGCYLGQELT